MATAKVYGPAALSGFNKEIDWDTDVVKAALVGAAYVPNQDTHRYWSDVVANEITGTGYTAGGHTVTGAVASYDAATNTVTLTCANPVWSTATVAFQFIVFYVSTGTDSTSPLVCYVPYDTVQSCTALNVNVLIPAAGLVQTTIA